MRVNIQDDIKKLRALDLLNDLLTDKTTKQNIIWATDTYSVYGTGYGCRESVTAETAPVIRIRVQKAMEQQSGEAVQRYALGKGGAFRRFQGFPHFFKRCHIGGGEQNAFLPVVLLAIMSQPFFVMRKFGRD